MTTPKYKRILLKLSGEALMGDSAYGINPQTITGICGEIKAVADLGDERHGVIRCHASMWFERSRAVGTEY